jgi:hypothetical protein
MDYLVRVRWYDGIRRVAAIECVCNVDACGPDCIIPPVFKIVSSLSQTPTNSGEIFEEACNALNGANDLWLDCVAKLD